MSKKVICKKCKCELNAAGNNFGKRIVDGKQYYRHLCKACFNLYTSERRNSTQNTLGVYDRRKKKLSEERQSDPARLLANGYRKWDKQHGFVPDIDKDFVREMIKRGCYWCGATYEEIRIGLDRIDNRLGHTKVNVNPACVRCNLTRKDMPYEAWLLVAQGMRQAHKLRKFGTWVPGNRRKALTVLAELDAAKADGPSFRTEREWNDVDHAGQVLGEKFLASRATSGS